MEITELKAAVQTLVNDQDRATLETLYAMLLDKKDSLGKTEALHRGYRAMAQDGQREANDWIENTFTQI